MNAALPLVGDPSAFAPPDFAAMFDDAPGFIAVTLGPAHRYVYVNAASRRLFGARVQVGTIVADAMPESIEQGFHAQLDAVYRDGRAYEAQAARYRVPARDGQPAQDLFIDFSYSPVRGADGLVVGILTQGSDVSGRVRIDAALRDSEARLRDALRAGRQASADLRTERERLELALSAGRMGAYDLDIPTGALWWSPQTYALMGLDPARFTPTLEGVAALIHPDDRASVLARRATALAAGGGFDEELRVRSPDGQERWIDWRGQSELDAQGRPIRSFGVVTDITERKRFEALLRDEDRRKDDFIATLAHELRNPLAPIRNAVALMRRVQQGLPDGAVPEAGAAPVPGARDAACAGLDIIDRQVGRMAHLLDDLLDVSRLTRGQLRLRREPILLATVIEQALEVAQPSIAAGRHAFASTLPDAPVWLDGDPTRLAQVLSNVLINAAKYTPPGGHIALVATACGPELRIAIRDDGIGIAAADLSRIFEMFGRIESAQPHRQDGQGIGLALARGLLALHGGTIDARSDGPGRGSEFTIVLPAIPAPARPDAITLDTVTPDTVAPDTVAPDTVAPGASLPVQRLQVLIADDLRDIADSLASLLRAHGHAVAVAYDGEQAWQLARSQRPDVVLLDVGMPGLDGYQVCRRIRATDWGRAALMVAQTGWGQERDRRRAMEAGFDRHLTKPVRPQALLELLDGVDFGPTRAS